jgi:hypothetical protein
MESITLRDSLRDPIWRRANIDDPLRDAILGNVGTIVSFSLGLNDAEILEKEFYPVFSAKDLINLPNYHIYLRLMIDGVVSQGFSGETLKPSDCAS